MPCFPDLGLNQVKEVYRQIETHGFCRLDGLIAADSIAEAVVEAQALISGNGDQYLSITGQQGLTSWLLNGLHADHAFKRLCSSLYVTAVGQHPAEERFHQVLRCLAGDAGQAHSRYLHFDSYVISALVPLAIPQAGAPGDLILLPRRRRIKQPYLLNAAQKLALDLAPTQKLLWWLIGRGLIEPVRVRLHPGSIYFFLGHTSIHANEVCTPDELRVTALYHFGNFHEESPVRRWAADLRRQPAAPSLSTGS